MNKKIYLVFGTSWEETEIREAFIDKEVAELHAEYLNFCSDDYYWYSVEEIKLIGSPEE